MIGWSANPVDITPVLDANADVLRGWGFQVAFGQRFNVPNNSLADIWTGTATTRPLPLAGKPMSIVSTSASDNATRLVGITFVDDAGDWRTSDLLPLNGLTPVPITYKPGQELVTEGATPTLPDGTSTPATIYRVQDVAVFVAGGATEAAPRVSNIGVLTIVDTATATVVYDHIPIGFGRSQTAAFHVPRGYSARLTRVQVGTARGSGRVDIASTFGLGTAFQRLPLTPLNDAAVIFINDASTTPIEPRSDLQALIVAGSNSIDVSCILQLRLKPTTPLPP